jgi:glycosyltransferase involved in cell wall biosynthesis
MSRVVMYVFNDATNDSRVLREAAALAAAGHQVTLMARSRDLEDPNEQVEERDGFTIVRVPVTGAWWEWWRAAVAPRRAPALVAKTLAAEARRFPMGWLRAFGVIVSLGALATYGLVRRSVRIVRERVTGREQRAPGNVAYVRRWLLLVEDWARAASERAPAADVHHGHDLTGLPAAARAATRDRARLVYDSHELFLESADHALRWGIVRRALGRLERRWSAAASAVVTVNGGIAAELEQRIHPPRLVVVHNCPPRWDPPDRRPDLFRTMFAIPPDAPIALYHGRLTVHRGIEPMADALLQPGMEHVHGVVMGYGPLKETIEQRAAEPGIRGRLHVMGAVPPDELLPWVASADVGIVAIHRSSLNHWLSTPNKLFECIAAGVPVVASDFPEIRRVVMDPDGPLGVLCDPEDVSQVVQAIRSVVDAPADERDALRARCLRAAHERWNWETESAKLVELYADLVPERVVATA